MKSVVNFVLVGTPVEHECAHKVEILKRMKKTTREQPKSWERAFDQWAAEFGAHLARGNAV